MPQILKLFILLYDVAMQTIPEPPTGWERAGIVTILVAILLGAGWLSVTGKVRVGSVVDAQLKDKDDAYTAMCNSKDAHISSLTTFYEGRLTDMRSQVAAQLAEQRENCGKWEKIAMSQFDTIDDIRSQLDLALKALTVLGATKEK